MMYSPADVNAKIANSETPLSVATKGRSMIFSEPKESIASVELKLNEIRADGAEDLTLNHAEQLDNYLFRACVTVDKQFVLGSSNKKTDVERTNKWNIAANHRYYKNGKYERSNINGKISWCYKPGPHGPSDQYCDYVNLTALNPMDKISNPRHVELVLYAILGMRARQGNCLIKSCALAYFLWKRNSNLIKTIEVCKLNNLDHAFVVINRDPGSDISDPATWDSHSTRIVDLWAGHQKEYPIYKSALFNDRMYETLTEHNFPPLKPEIIYSIKTESDLYPEDLDVDAYYDLDMGEKIDIEDINKYKACIEPLKRISISSR